MRARLTDEQRSLRIYGSEVVVARLTGGTARVRLHLINYGGRDIEGLRVRLRGTYRRARPMSRAPARAARRLTVADGSTEFSLPRLATYAVVDLK